MIPTYEQCLEIVKNNNTFFMKEEFFWEYKIVIFSYELARYSDFNEPIKDNKEIQAFELRGLSFLFNSDNTLYKRNLSIQKFFNVNETEITLQDNIKDKKIKEIFDKSDGSLIIFLQIPNGQIIAKSRTTIFSDHAQRANRIYENNEGIRNIVDRTITDNKIALWEFVSPEYQIVMYYPQDNLVLLGIRDQDTGEWLDIYDKTIHDKYKLEGCVKVQKEEYNSIEQIKELAETTINKEGWVITFEGGLKVKIKTKWYLALHHLYSNNNTFRENLLVEMILTEKIDDVISNLQGGLKDKIVEMNDKVVKYYNKILTEIKNFISGDWMGDRKLFAIQFQNYEYFPVLMKSINEPEKIAQHLKEYIIKKTNSLTKAREFVKSHLES